MGKQAIDHLLAAPLERRFDRLMARAAESPADLPALAEVILGSGKRAGTLLDTTLTLMPAGGFARLVPLAVARLEAHGSDENAASVIDYCALQSIETLRPFLTRLLPVEGLHPRGAWRAAGPEEERYLLEACQRRDALGRRARERVGEIGSEAALAACVRPLDHGFVKKKGGGYRRLFVEHPLHLSFDPRFLGPPAWLTVKPSCWTSDAPRVARFGGAAECVCAVCSERAHHVLTLDPVPPSLALKRLERLELATCLSCLGWSRPTLSFRHDERGRPSPLPVDLPRKPEFPSRPLLETRVGLADQGPRWWRQDWGHANSRENLNRLGGFPTFVQEPVFPACPLCRRRSSFLLQLDSGLPLEGGNRHVEWGAGGIAYAYFCGSCHVSTWLWQCT